MLKTKHNTFDKYYVNICRCVFLSVLGLKVCIYKVAVKDLTVQT